LNSSVTVLEVTTKRLPS